MTSRHVDGVEVLTPDRYEDERGTFWSFPHPPAPETSRYCMTRSSKGVIRGLHFRPGDGEAKLVRCSAGTVYDVIVDLRPGSETYRNSMTLVLTGRTQQAVWIPAGCAHGYQALKDDTDVAYRIDAAYGGPDADVAIAWNDPELNIQWPLPPGPMSNRDRNAPPLARVLEKLHGR